MYHQTETIIGEGKWLKLCNEHFTDKNGVERDWETIVRRNVNPNVQCVDIFAVLLRKDHCPQQVLVRQYRPASFFFFFSFLAFHVDFSLCCF